HVAWANIDAGLFRGALEIGGGDRVAGLEALCAGDVEDHPTPNERIHRLDTQLLETRRRLDAFVDMNAAVKRQILCLVGERVDVSARRLRTPYEAGGAGA